MYVARGRAVGEDIVRGLQVEGLFDLCVGGAEEVQEGDCEEEDVCVLLVSGRFSGGC